MMPFSKIMRLPESKAKIVQNLLWAVSGKVVTLAGSLAIGILVARYLGPKQYGLMNYVISYVSLFQIFATFGLDNIEIREEARRSKKECGKILGTALAIRIALAAITIAAIAVTALLSEPSPETILYIAIYSLSTIANTFIAFRNYFTAIVKNKHIARSEITRTILSVAIKILMLYAHCTLIWFIAAVTLDYFLLAAGYLLSYKKEQSKDKMHLTFDKDCARYLMKESFPILLTSATVIIYQRIDQVLIGLMIDKESVGYFSVAARIVEILIYIPQISIQTVMPILIRKKEKSKTDYYSKMQMFMGLVIWATLGIALVVSLLSGLIVPLLFGDTYNNSVEVLRILAFKAPAIALSTLAGHMLIIEGLQRYAIFRDMMGCIFCVAMNLLLLSHYGIVAAAFIAIASNIVAGYVADLIIPPYRTMFVMQTKALLFGWKDLLNIKQIIRS